MLLIILCQPVLAEDEILSREGYFVLNFDSYSSKYDTLIVEQSSPEHWQQRFDVTGQRQVTLSGFADGQYQAFLTQSNSDNPQDRRAIADIRVQHHALSQALTLFALGLVTFVILIISLVTLSKRAPEHV